MMICNNFAFSRKFCITRASVLFVSRNWRRRPNPPKWRKPERGIVKLNFDGASKPAKQKASIGGVYRNHNGVFLLGYSESIGMASSSVAEFVAVKRGLQIALQNGYMNVWIEGDAKFVVDMLKKQAEIRAKDDIIHVEEIKKLLSLLDHFDASHIYRDGNKVADKLSKLGYFLNEPKIWRGNPPVEIERYLCEDRKKK